MALIHWWPLTGSNNQTEMFKDVVGNNNLRYVGSNGSIEPEQARLGIGLKRQETGTNDLLRTRRKIKQLGEQSIALWVKLETPADLGTANGLVSNHDHNTSNGLGIGVYSSDGENCYISINAGTGSSRIHSDGNYRGRTNIKDAWHHVCVTYSPVDKYIHMYVDGKEDYTPKTYNLATKTDYFDLFNWSTGYSGNVRYRPTCTLSDVRVYDHQLTPFEISEIIKTKIAHFTFEAPPKTTNYNYSKISQWSVYTTYWGVTDVTSTGWKLSKAGKMDKSPTVAISNSTIGSQMSVGDFWTISCYLYKNGEPLRAVGNIFSNYMGTIPTVSYDRWENGFFRVTFKIDSKSNNYLIHAPFFGNISAIKESDEFEIRDLRVEKNDFASTLNCNNDAGINIGAQISIGKGYQKSWAARGKKCLYCDNTKISFTSSEDYTHGVSASFWLKTGSYPSTNQVVFADGHSRIAFGFYNGSNAIISCAGTSSNVVSNLSSKWSSDWNHVCVVRQPTGAISCYVNGQLATQSTSTNNWSSSSTDCTIGCRINGSATTYYTGHIDDFRMYQTALSADDIQDIYNTGAYIDEDNLSAEFFIEDSAEAGIQKNHLVGAPTIQETDLSDIVFLESITSSGTQYIDTNYYWTSEKATVVADLTYVTPKSSSTLFGNEERYSGSSRYFAHILHAGSANGNFAHYIGTSSVGAALSLTTNKRYLIEYEAHGDNTFSSALTLKSTGVRAQVNNKVAYTGSIQTRKHSTQTNVANRGHIFIFSNHNAYNGAGAIQNVAAMILYRFTMYDNGKMVRDFVPAKQGEVVGLFDLVEGKFYSSPNGIAFTAGPEVVNTTNVEFLKDGSLRAGRFMEI